MVSVDVKHHVFILAMLTQSPGEIKRREVSWTLRTEEAIPEEIKNREVVLC